jgi:hypothetical protein
MITALQKRILIYVSVGFVVAILGYFMIEQLKFESQLDDLKKFCGGLKVQSSLDEVQVAVAFAPGLRMTLLEPGPDGGQIGSVFFDGAGRGGCSVNFMRGRLTQKTFFFGVQDPTKPGEKLKPW